MFEKISEVFDVEHVLEDEGKRQLPMTIDNHSDEPNDAVEKANEDFEYARTKIKDAIENASVAMEEMLDLSRAAEHPRAYEVMNGIASNITSMAEALVKLHKETLKNIPKQESGNVTNQNLVLTTDAVIALLKSKNKSN